MRVIELSNHPGDMLHDVSLRRQATQRAPRPGTRTRSSSTRPASRPSGSSATAPASTTSGGPGCASSSPSGPSNAARPASSHQRGRHRYRGEDQGRDRGGAAGRDRTGPRPGRRLDPAARLPQPPRRDRPPAPRPRGLFAIEVKNINATVSIDGDRWRADKYDNYGNLVEQRRGRRPQGPLAERAAQRVGRRAGAVPARARPAGHRPARGGPHPPPVAGRPPPPPHRPRRHLDRLRAEPGQRLQGQSSTSGSGPTSERLIRRDHDFYERRRRYPGGP